MKIKCIGGICDGKWIWVEDYFMKEGEFVKVPKPIMALVVEFNPNKLPDIIDTVFLIYKVATFCFKANDYCYFLIPENWTSKEAMLYQFGK